MHPIALEFVFEEFNQYINANLDGQSIYYPILHLDKKEEKKKGGYTNIGINSQYNKTCFY
jgi:hypothetical protein